MSNKDIAFILRDNEFLTWIIDELDKHFHIDDIGFKENNYYTDKIKALYDLVAEYAKKHGIESEKSMQFSIYYVEYRGTIFFIYEGAMSYGCFKNNVNKKGLPYCIDLEDVRNSKMEEMINSDNSILKGLKNELNKLYNKGFSPEFIGLIMGRILSNDKDKEDDYKKRGKR